MFSSLGRFNQSLWDLAARYQVSPSSRSARRFEAARYSQLGVEASGDVQTRE